MRNRSSLPTILLLLLLLPCAGRAERIVAEALPDPQISGYTFPEAEATLTRWVTEATRAEPAEAAAAFEKIQLHGWGLWTALTAETKQFAASQQLRVFETWFTPDDLMAQPGATSTAQLEQLPRGRAPLRIPAQLARRDEPVERDDTFAASGDTTVSRVLGFTKFDRTAADHILRQQLFNTAALDALVAAGAQQITPFPVTSLAVKPVFKIIKADELVSGRYYALKAWRGPPAAPQAWEPAQWPGGVWIDVRNGGSGRGAIDEAFADDGSTRRDETTYPLSSFIAYRLNAADAAALSATPAGAGTRPGDLAILVAMHVATREIARWTWQTFWWTPAPDHPPVPSSDSVAGLRPPELRGAARNYAMALTYAMLSPDQPYVGGSNDGAAVYAYNPWIEARFGPAELPDSQPGFDASGRPAANNHGVESNCMSCHAQANYNPRKFAHAPGFTGARYVDLAAPQFAGTLQVDFLWSIARHAR